jgi:hypothetical protein
MSDLSDFLALATRSEGRFTTLRATIREWTDEVVARRAGD